MAKWLDAINIVSVFCRTRGRWHHLRRSVREIELITRCRSLIIDIVRTKDTSMALGD
ncbi:hypothetical protein SCLCIDRAFT_1211948 [Scleroderma citrinum Foug A]|uniref:Uncharacterized protein n=1 Tax=Scleroderma citrinum Foug A TaxID=1036808 RepID=A0A0C2ZWV2_9AGAM|nr:hypothetical protein SCLCIDRAFT_1211948 [Scleroderma citrinum Foug A]